MELAPEIIILLMFSTLMLLMLTGQRVFAAMGFVGVAAALAVVSVLGAAVAVRKK